MISIVCLLLACTSVWGFPDRRTVEHPAPVPNPSPAAQLSKVSQQQQEKQDNVREAQNLRERDCKGKCASSIAQKAAAEAKAAQAAQNAAGAQAAHMVKTQLAEKALQAAKAAEAALAGKQAVVEQLQQEVKEAEAVVAENTAAVHQQQGTVNSAVQTAQQATAQHKLLVQATLLAAALERSAHCLLDKSKFGLREKCHHLADARSRLAQLQHKLQCACADCAATKTAAHSACEAARAACGNARRKRHVSNKIHSIKNKDEPSRRKRPKRTDRKSIFRKKIKKMLG